MGKFIYVTFNSSATYKVDTDDLPKKWDESTLAEMHEEGKLDDICLDYSEHEDPTPEIDEE